MVVETVVVETVVVETAAAAETDVAAVAAAPLPAGSYLALHRYGTPFECLQLVTLWTVQTGVD